MMRSLVALLLLLPAPAWAVDAASPSEVLTLDHALALALQNNHSIQAAALQVRRADEGVGAARAQRLPLLDVRALVGGMVTPVRIGVPQGALGDFPATGPIPSADTLLEAPRALTAHVSASVAQPLSQLHKIGVGVRLQELSRDIEREQLRAARAAVASDVKRLYFGLLQTDGALAAVQEELLALRELERVVVEHVARETALPGELLDVRAGLAAAAYKAASLRNGMLTAKQQLNDLLGRELERDFTLEAAPEPTPLELDMEAAVGRALERRPELRQARLRVDQAQADRSSKRADYVPELSLAFNYFSFANVQLLPRHVAALGVQLQWQPFDWGRRAKQVAEKTLQLEQARSAARAAENQVRIEVANRVRKLQESRLLLEASRLARDSAQEKLRVAATRHAEEAALLKDVLQAKAKLADGNAQCAQALLAFWTARADLEKALGEDQ